MLLLPWTLLLWEEPFKGGVHRGWGFETVIATPPPCPRRGMPCTTMDDQ